MNKAFSNTGKKKKILVNYLVHGKHKSTDVNYTKNFAAIASKELGIEVCFNENKWIPQLVEFFHKLDIQLRHFPWLQQKLRPLLKSLSTRTVIFPGQLRDVDAVLTHWYYPLFTPIKKVPVIYSSGFHGNHYAGFSDDQARKKSNNFKIVQKKKNKSAVSFLPAKSWISHFQRINQQNNFGKIDYLPHLLPEAKKEIRFLKEKFQESVTRIIFVGRDGKRKGLLDIIIVLKKILQKYPNLKKEIYLTVVSNTNVDLSQAGIPGQYLPEVTKSEVLRLMKQSHIFCMPTHHESYGHVFVEAMGSSCAIIADNRDPRTEILNYGKIGQLVTPGNHQELETALLKYLQDHTLLESHAALSFKKFNQEYAYEVVIERLQKIILNHTP